jgi:ATP-dependent DNA helicase RecQ
LATFDAARRSFLERVLAQAKKGRIWLSLNPAVVGTALGEDRERVVKALDYLAEKGAIELRAADFRARYRRLRELTDHAALVEALAVRFERREQSEVGRIQEMLALVVSPNCQANQLAERFGEVRSAPCGQCSACRSVPRTVEPLADPGPLGPVLPPARLAALRREAEVLQDSRSLARFLCGLSSPGLTRAKLQKHPLFAALEAWPFAAVLAHVELPQPTR